MDPALEKAYNKPAKGSLDIHEGKSAFLSGISLGMKRVSSPIFCMVSAA